ncbi:MAG: Endonuclease III [candidate division WS2 bacterium]|nr:Endonuclease III [Candidatus Psychracetigena formicireducens]
MNIDDLEKVLNTLQKHLSGFNKTVISSVIEKTNDAYWILISCLLSLRTKDTVTLDATNRLYTLAKTPEEIIQLPIKLIEDTIYPVGFYRKKSLIVKEVTWLIITKYQGKVPDNIDALLSIPGVGRKTANIVLSRAFKIPAIAVDTHVHRITNRLGLVKTKNPDKTEVELMTVVPKKYWLYINDLLVTFGQNICQPLSPKCSNCPISQYCLRVGVTHLR